MNKINTRTNHGILFTDQYQLTMAQLYYRLGYHELTAQFDHFYRRNPDYSEPEYEHRAGYCINAGLGPLVHWMQQTRFHPIDIEYMRGMQTNTGNPLFANDFLAWLAEHGHRDLHLAAIDEEAQVVVAACAASETTTGSSAAIASRTTFGIPS